MLPQLKPKKGNSPFVPSQFLLEKNIELQNSILLRSEQRENVLVSCLDRLISTVSTLQSSFNQFQQNILNNSTQALALLTRMVKLQSGSVKAEKNALLQLEEMNNMQRSRGQSSIAPEERPRLACSEQVRISIEPEAKSKTQNFEAVKPKQPDPQDPVRLGEHPNNEPQSSSSSPIPKDISEVGRFGEFRDNHIIVSLETSIEGKKLGQQESIAAVKSHISHWLGYTFDFITKQSFAGYHLKRMLESEAKVYLCNNIILNFHNMISWLREHYPSYWNSYSKDFINLFIEGSSKSLSFQLIKYPQKQKMFISSDLQNLIPTQDDFQNPEHFIPGNLGLFFVLDPNSSYYYLRSVKLFLNGLIKEAQRCLPIFKELLKTVFTIQNGDQSFCVDHLIGMKFKENMPLYSEEEVNERGLIIKAPEVLRVVIKWIEELEEFITKPKKTLEKKKFFNKSGGPPIEFSSRFQNNLGEHLRFDAETLLAEVEALHSSIFNSTFFSIPEYIDSHRESLDYLPINSIRAGLTVNLLSEIYSDMAVQLLNKMIGFLNERIQYSHETSLGTVAESQKFNLEDIQFVPFSVGDLLRAKCSGKLDDIRKVLDNIQNHQNITLVRVKNRLETSNRDFLINFKFKGCALICELQVGLKDTGHDKQFDLDHYNHLLYELKRSKYGSVSQSVLIIANLTQIGSYFGKIIEKTPRKTSSSEEKINFQKKNFQLLKKDTTFICNNCMKLSKAFSSYLSSYKQKTADVFICGPCVYKMSNPTQRTDQVLGEGSSHIFESFTYSKDEPFPPSEFVIAITPGKIFKKKFITFRYLENAHISSERKYYYCFDRSEFYSFQDLEGQLLFKLRKQLIVVTLNLNMEVDQSEEQRVKLKNLLADSSDAQKFPAEFLEKAVTLRFFVNDQVNSPSFLIRGRCAVSVQHSLVIVFNEHIEKEEFQQDKRKLEKQKKIQELLKRKETQWILTNYNYTVEEFRKIVPNSNLEWLYLERSHFNTLNFMKSGNLRKLKMCINDIQKVDIGTNFPNLRQLDMMMNKLTTLEGLDGCPLLEKLEVTRNQIEVLDLTKLNLPNLTLLDVSSNKIHKVIGGNKVFLPKLEILLIGGDFQEVSPLVDITFADVMLPELRDLKLSNCDLKRVDINPGNFPKLKTLDIQYNRELTSLDLSQIDTLQALKAYNCALKQVKLSKVCPIKQLEIHENSLESFSLQGLNTAELLKVNLNHNALKRFEVQAAPKLHSLSIKSNVLVDLIFLGLLPSLSEVFLDYNYLKIVDLSEAGSLKKLETLSIKGNMLQKIIFGEDPYLINLATIAVDNNDMLQDCIPSSETISSQKLPDLKAFTIGRAYNYEYFRETMSRTIDEATANKFIEFAQNNPVTREVNKKSETKTLTEKDIRDLLALKLYQNIGNGEIVFQLYAKFLGVEYSRNKSAPNKLAFKEKSDTDPKKIVVFQKSESWENQPGQKATHIQ